MDKHKKAETLFSSYFDKDLTPEDNKWLEEHLNTCDNCQNNWDTYKQTMKEVSGLLKLAPPDDVVLKVESKINKRSSGKFFNRQKSPSIQFSIVSFILILFFILAYLVLVAVNEIVFLDTNNVQNSLSQTKKETPVQQQTHTPAQSQKKESSF